MAGKRVRPGEQLTITPPATRSKGRVERAVDADVVAARKAGMLADTSAGLIASARVTARQLDHAEHTSQVYAVRQLSSELRELYRAIGLSGGDDVDAFAAIVASLGAPQVVDDPPPAP